VMGDRMRKQAVLITRRGDSTFVSRDSPVVDSAERRFTIHGSGERRRGTFSVS